MQSIRLEETDRNVANVASEEASPFRAAFAEARRGNRRTAAVAADADSGLGEGDQRWSGSRFEVRIQKRRGSRAADTARWNELGADGWELVAVSGKHAFFRREHRTG